MVYICSIALGMAIGFFLLRPLLKYHCFVANRVYMQGRGPKIIIAFFLFVLLLGFAIGFLEHIFALEEEQTETAAMIVILVAMSFSWLELYALKKKYRKLFFILARRPSEKEIQEEIEQLKNSPDQAEFTMLFEWYKGLYGEDDFLQKLCANDDLQEEKNGEKNGVRRY